MPESHVYVRHLADPAAAATVVRLPDPVPTHGSTVPGAWWPPLMLEPDWIATHHHQFDVFHVHFGFDALSADTLAKVLTELRRRGKPLVYTAHDLRNPHHPDPTAHRAHLDLLVPAADEVITLTPGAAQQIRQQWDCAVTVLPHPHVAQRSLIERKRRRNSEHFTIGVHVKSLRANMDPFPVLDTLADLVTGLPGARLLINVHDELFKPDNHWYAPDAGAALMAYSRRPHVRVMVHPYFSEAQLWAYLSALNVSVLPYRFGTHSGWLEACYDLGTAVVAPRCGFFDEQRPCETYEFSEHSFDAESLRAAVRRLHRRYRENEHPPRATWPQRCAERVALAAAHHDLYHAVRQ